jgi:hypothetical protein
MIQLVLGRIRPETTGYSNSILPALAGPEYHPNQEQVQKMQQLL